jgi:glycerol-3-phosphate dehydrogenase (NAD(P)+)
MTSRRVGILGAGVWGVSFAWLAARGGREVLLWSSDAEKRARLRERHNTEATEAVELPDCVVFPERVEEVLGCDLLVLALQPSAIRPTLSSLASHFRPEHLVVHLVKGFEASGTPISEVIEQETRVLRTGAVAGPIVPSELWQGDDAAVIVGSCFQEVIDAVTAVVTSPSCRVYGTRDLIGLEVAGAMRTPISVAIGVLRGQRTGRALAAVLLTRGLAEASRLAEALGGDPRTASGLSGIGDWMLTATDPDEPLLLAGGRLAEGEDFGWLEAESRIRTLIALGQRLGVELPITEAVGHMLDGVPVPAVLQGLMSRAPRGETD